jgi:hypothetical protein
MKTLKIILGALLSVFIIVANDNGSFGGNKDLSKSQIQRDQINNPGNQSGKAASNNSAPRPSAYPPLPN